MSKSVVGKQEMEAVAAVLERGFLGMGREVCSFEEELSSFFSARSVACVNTGTAALQLALQAVGVGVGDEVLVPSLTYVASFQAISACGAVPVACDVYERNGLLDLEDAARRISSRTKVIMPVHYASSVGDLDAIYDFAARHGLRVVEDAAHAFGCEYKGQRIGSIGDVVCFSFDGIKNITSGEGGAVVTSDAAVLERIQDCRLLGVEKDSEKRYVGERSWEFDVTEQGWRYHMSDIMAAIGRVQLRRFEMEFKPKRIQLAQRYQSLLNGVPGVALLAADYGPVVPHIFPVRILDGKRERVRNELLERGVQVGIHYLPNHLLTKFGGGKVSLPVTEGLYLELLSLPLHPDLTESEVSQVVATIRSCL
ncbi:MAG: DegT/DnrJ/EryC1/StrS family aminotransferase [Sulfuricella sp.]|nr:DegT/DnrJ/EryC1/StrS family aminotransferase [Sulfuricella sp.]